VRLVMVMLGACELALGIVWIRGGCQPAAVPSPQAAPAARIRYGWSWWVGCWWWLAA
jgi:hypothetical protein